MTYDLTFDEAIDVLQSKIGWVQGENFNRNEYLAIDRKRDLFIKNAVCDEYFGCVFPMFGDRTVASWTDTSYMHDDMRNQKYRFILVLNRDSVKGEGAYSDGNDRNSYLWHKRMNIRKTADEQNEQAKKEVCAIIKNTLKDYMPADKFDKVDEIFYSVAEGYVFTRKEGK